MCTEYSLGISASAACKVVFWLKLFGCIFITALLQVTECKMAEEASPSCQLVRSCWFLCSFFFIDYVCKEIKMRSRALMCGLWSDKGWRRDSMAGRKGRGSTDLGQTRSWGALSVYFWQEEFCWKSEPFFWPLPVAFELEDVLTDTWIWAYPSLSILDYQL